MLKGLAEHRKLAVRLCSAGTLACVAVLAMCGQALANTATLTFTDSAGKSDPAADVGRTLTLSGNSTISQRVYMEYRPAGGAPCAPSADSDSGNGDLPGFGWVATGQEINGNFTLKATGDWSPPGTFMFCIWLAKGSSESVTPITQTITFRAPVGTISATVTPTSPQPGESATVTVVGSSEAPERVYATIRPAGGAPCAPTYQADSGHGLIEGASVNGAFSLGAKTVQSNPGTYLICLWLAESYNASPAIAGPQPETFTVVAPPPPCVVPAFNPGMTLTSLEQRLTAAHCTVGKITYTHSRSIRKGTVVRLGTASGTHLGSGAAVAVVVSSGSPARKHRHRKHRHRRHHG